MTMDTSKVLRLPRKLQHIFWKRRKSIAPATQNDFRHVAEHVWMSRSATPATRNEATTHWKPPKMTTSAELPIGTAIRSSYERLRTVATVNATSSEHSLNPQTPRVKREPLLRIRELYIRKFSSLPCRAAQVSAKSPFLLNLQHVWRKSSAFALPQQPLNCIRLCSSRRSGFAARNPDRFAKEQNYLHHWAAFRLCKSWLQLFGVSPANVDFVGSAVVQYVFCVIRGLMRVVRAW